MDSKYSAFNNGKSPAVKMNGEGSFSTKRKFPAPPTKINNYGKMPKLNPPRNGGIDFNEGNALTKNNNVNRNSNQSGNKNNNNIYNKNNLSKVQVEQQRSVLPVYQCRMRIIREMRKSDTLLLMGETGSGKTTQIPQFLMENGFAQRGMIAVTQPRRVAAITIARRVAQEQQCQLGEKVGYTVRFEDCTCEDTKIRYMTDGSLLREALSDRLLRQYSIIMLDEAHERTVNTDVLFGIVKEAQRERFATNMYPLKIIVTSATMDIDHFGKYFSVNGMYLEGRTHPVKVMHAKHPQSDYIDSTLITLFDLHRKLPLDHDVLVFLTGQEEIEAMAMQVRQISKAYSNLLAPVRVFPLYAQMPQHKQLDCFLPAPTNARKIILSTNIAETSITIPGIRCVLDCGYVKRRMYNANSGLDVLRVVRISQAQAWQRCGRAGRDAPGICYRTYTQTEMNGFEQMPKPEILQCNLSTTALQLLAMNIDFRSFDFLDRPTPDAIESAYCKLDSLGAIVKTLTRPKLTELGRRMSKFPVDPTYGKLLLSASQFGCMDEILSLVAVLSGETLFVTQTEKREQAALAHAKFKSKHGDHLTLLNVFNAFNKSEKPKLWCHDNFLNLRNLTYAREVRGQLLEIAQRMHLKINSCGNNFNQVRKCLLVGLYDNIAESQRDNTYLTVSGRQRAKIHPSSVFHGTYRPEYLIFTEMVLTERNYLLQVTEINPQWIAEVVPNYAHLNRIKCNNPCK